MIVKRTEDILKLIPMMTPVLKIAVIKNQQRKLPMNQSIQQDIILQKTHQAHHQTTPKLDLREKEGQKRKLIHRRSKGKIQMTIKDFKKWKKI